MMIERRIITPEIYHDEDLNDAELMTGLPFRTLFMGILALSDKGGFFSWKPHFMALKICPYHKKLPFDFVLSVLKYLNIVIHYRVKARNAREEDREYGWVPSFTYSQSPDEDEKHEEYPSYDEGEHIPLTKEENRLIDSIFCYEKDVFSSVLEQLNDRLCFSMAEQASDKEKEGDTLKESCPHSN